MNSIGTQTPGGGKNLSMKVMKGNGSEIPFVTRELPHTLTHALLGRAFLSELFNELISDLLL